MIVDMKNKNLEFKEKVLSLYFDEKMSKEDILKQHCLIGANTLDFWINERNAELSNRQKEKTANFTNYQSEADGDFHIYLKKENFLLDMPHYHESVEIIFMLKGSTVAHIGENAFLIKAGEICFSNKFQNHFYEKQSSDLEAFCIVLGHDYTHSFRQCYNDKTPPALMQNLEANKEIISLVRKWYNEKNRAFLLNCAYSNFLFEVISRFYPIIEQKTTSAEHIAIQFIDYIQNNYRSNISLSTMAQHFGYTKEYCSKIFNKTVGQHFNTFLNSVRIRKAEEIIKSPEGSNRKITDIIYDCGFTSPFTYYRHRKAPNTNPTKT